jgi:translation initiation factor IF-3
VILGFWGSEIDHQALGCKLLQRVRADMAEIAKVELDPKPEGRQIIMIMSPKGKG